jgi:hypothetical protein
MSNRRKVLLAASRELSPTLAGELAKGGIELVIPEAGISRPSKIEVDGLLVSTPSDLAAWQEDSRLRQTPGLLLVYGWDIPYGWADQQMNAMGTEEDQKWEIVRMTILVDQDRAWIGGDPDRKWVSVLCRQLASCKILSYVCSMREVDEAVRQLPRYLAWKERFFIELGEVCDTEGISLQGVARALGMDRRIGQQWLYPKRSDHRAIGRWLEREVREIMKKTNIHRIALWGPFLIWKQIPTGWLEEKEVSVYLDADEPIPKEIPSAWSFSGEWDKVLENADLLVILHNDGVIGELPLPGLARTMKQSIVLDTAACFPPQEAQAYLKSYRAIGEKTNVWE